MLQASSCLADVRISQGEHGILGLLGLRMIPYHDRRDKSIPCVALCEALGQNVGALILSANVLESDRILTHDIEQPIEVHSMRPSYVSQCHGSLFQHDLDRRLVVLAHNTLHLAIPLHFCRFPSHFLFRRLRSAAEVTPSRRLLFAWW